MNPIDNLRLLSLSDLIAGSENTSGNFFGQEYAEKLLSLFSIRMNRDVENFAHKNAIPYEKANKGRTYIIVDQAGYPLAYFTLGLGRLSYSGDISQRLWKKLRGVGDGDATVLTCILLGQLARNDDVSYDILPKGFLFSQMLNKVYEGQSILGGRLLLAECVDDLIEYYSKYNFRCLYKNPNNGLNQMVLFL